MPVQPGCAKGAPHHRLRAIAGASCLALSAGLAGLPALALADTATMDAGQTQPGQSQVDELIVIAKRSDTYNVLPTRVTSSTFGLPMSLSEVPRSITLIEQPIISLYGIKTIDDFVNITPGTFTGNYFGVPGDLTVRGDLADNFFRGFRRVENPGNFPTDVDEAEYVEIIKGPPPPNYGGGKVGGILNFVPKGPTDPDGELIDHQLGLASVTYGTYNERIANLEGGAPFTLFGAPSAVYASLHGEDSDSFYNGIYKKDVLGTLSAKTDFSPRFSIEYGLMLQGANLNQNLGWNRVTQALVDSNGADYLAGRPQENIATNGVNLTPAELAAAGLPLYGNGPLTAYAFANPFEIYYLSPAQQAAFALNPATVGYVPISHQTILAQPSDYDKSFVTTGYFDFVYQLSANWLIKNQSFFDQMINEKYSSYGFSARYHDHVFENKTTLSGQYSPNSWLSLSPVVGASIREVWGLQEEAEDVYQAVNRRDLSYGATPNDIFESALAPGSTIPWNQYQQGGHSDLGTFAVLDAKFFDKLTAVVGGRWDYYDVRVVGTDISTGAYGAAKAARGAGSYNASLTYKVTPLINVYATYASSDFVELGQGGMIEYSNVIGNDWIQPSSLWEAGLKGYLLNGKMYFNALYYDQTRTAYNEEFGNFEKYESKGEEIEGHYAASKRLSFIGTATFQSSVQLSTPYFNGIPPQVLGLNPVQTYGGNFVGNGYQIGYPGPVQVPEPKSVLGLTGTYTDPKGWGVSIGVTHSSSMYAGYTQSVVLPAYTVVRAAIFYNVGKWSLQINANNIFNAQYFLPQSLFNEVLILPSQGPTAELTIKRRF